MFTITHGKSIAGNEQDIQERTQIDRLKENMESIKTIKEKDIVLFRTEYDQEDNCRLRDFLNFLKYMKVKRPIKFAHVDKDATLIRNLSLKDNIFLESIPNSLASSKDVQLREFFEKKDNLYLNRLFDRIDKSEKKSEEANQEIRKLTALIKGFIQEVDYLFFESPEKHLSDENLKIFINALRYHSCRWNRISFIKSPLKDFWYQICSVEVVFKNDKGCSISSCKSFHQETINDLRKAS